MIQEVRVNAEQCLGCGNCEQTCSAVFRLTYKVHAEVVGKDFEKHQKKMLAAFYGCPVQAIELISDDPALQIVWRTARIIEKRMLSETVMEVRLQTTAMDFRPGQFVTVRFKDDVGFFNRAYSIVECSNGVLALCVTLVKGGRGSSFLANYDVGCSVELTLPKGDFCLHDTPNPKVFIGTGTGLAPLVAMMERCPDARKTLFFGQRKEQDLFYLDRMAKIPNLDIRVCLSRANETWTGLRGRVTEHFLGFPLTRDTEVYACGSDDMLKSLQGLLKKKRHPKALFSMESFSNINGMTAKLNDPGLTRRIWVRHVHVYASLAMSVLFLFFGLSGFLASRPSLFNAEMQAVVPENVKLEQAELSGYLKAKLPARYTLKDGTVQKDAINLRFEDALEGRCDVAISLPDRTYTITESHALPEDARTLTGPQLAERLARQFAGKLDAGSVEDAPEKLQFNVESVWADTAVAVDKSQRRYEVHQTRSRWAAALVKLHRGKKSSPPQRILIDLTGLFMVMATLTGMVMGLQSRNPTMRITSLILIVTSLLLTAIMIFNR